MTSFMNSSEELNQIIENFYSYIKHPYLQKFIGDPAIDRDQTYLLYEMLKEKELDNNYISNCIITTTLVQTALNTHDLISVNKTNNSSLQTKRQLTVLAGDYYSSLYYFLLSKVNDVSLIRVLAKSIQEINESKMNVYNDDYLRGCLHDLHTIDSSLLQNIAHMLQMPEWKKVVTEYFFLKRLIIERFELVNSGVKGFAADVMLKEVDRKSLSETNQLIHQFDRQIELSKEKLLDFTNSSTNIGSFFRSRVHELFEEHGIYEHSVVEEG
ncbi:heptaprenyl diphosphate synthase component 1 [Bacillus shivajii]|uniref:heptaprenyl diphosphate synthase component 1 n=1 Tax=Bacillus shivajii TaxID=1983719 RepID=UPI001CFA55F6|nr:heptaprenyl diphosphate synthase component 1 [Bacillus shivajii]UCZ54771.1 heptaprenyl diphosphate synthase component 1 [Bacillus shivajii]